MCSPYHFIYYCKCGQQPSIGDCFKHVTAYLPEQLLCPAGVSPLWTGLLGRLDLGPLVADQERELVLIQERGPGDI